MQVLYTSDGPEILSPWQDACRYLALALVEARTMCDGIIQSGEMGVARVPASRKRRLRESALPLLGAFGRITSDERPVFAAERTMTPC
jgi:hypothetical protein